MSTEMKRSFPPIMLISAVAFILFCGAGIAAVMGWLPDSKGRQEYGGTPNQADQVAVDHPKEVFEMRPQSHASSLRQVSNERLSCLDCGVIESIRANEISGQGSGVGAISGAVVGGGRSKDAMTVVGAIGGALAGNSIEENVKSTTSHEIVVRMNNGSSQIIHENTQSTWHSGDHVRIADGVIRSN